MAIYSIGYSKDFEIITDHREIITVIMNTLCQTSVQYEALIYLSTRLRSREAPVTNNATQNVYKSLATRLCYTFNNSNFGFYVTNTVHVEPTLASFTSLSLLLLLPCTTPILVCEPVAKHNHTRATLSLNQLGIPLPSSHDLGH